jgi:hypothetical protein
MFSSAEREECSTQLKPDATWQLKADTASKKVGVRQKGQPELSLLLPRTVARGAGDEGFSNMAIGAADFCRAV